MLKCEIKVHKSSREFYISVSYALVTLIKTLSRLKHSVINVVLNASIFLSERIKDDYGTKRVLDFDKDFYFI